MKKLYILLCFFVAFKSILAQPCNYASTTPITIGQVISVKETCPYNGSITINNVTGGGGNYIYEIVAGPITRIIQSQNTFNTLTNGEYTVRVSSCNGMYKDTTLYVDYEYEPMRTWHWGGIKLSGYKCGINNDGVYKFRNAWFSNNGNGKKPYRYQINTTNNFTSIPYEPTLDTAIFSNLMASTTYYVRITDACNQSVVTTLNTAAIQPVVANREPYLQLTPSNLYSCADKGNLDISINDITTGTPYLGNLAAGNFAYFGNRTSPYLRIQIKNTANNTIYLDQNCKVVFTYGYYGVERMYEDGETGLSNAAQIGYASWWILQYGNIVEPFTARDLPLDVPLTVTTYFPGGNQCGTIIPPSTKTINTIIPSVLNPFSSITVQSSCNAALTTSNNLILTSSTNFYGKISVFDLTPTRQEIFTFPQQGSTPSGYFNINAGVGYTTWGTNLIVGKTYRVLWEDNCGRKDSVNHIFNPGAGTAPPTTMTDTVVTYRKCVYNAADSMYQLRIRPLPLNYLVTGITINGNNFYGDFTSINWPGYNNSLWGIKVNKLLPAGTYNYTVYYSIFCSNGSYSGTFTTPPPVGPIYTAELTANVTNYTQTCSVDNKTVIQLGGYIKNGNTKYSLANIRLLTAPNNNVFPIKIVNSYPDYHENITHNNENFDTYLIGLYPTPQDSIYFSNYQTGLILRPGQEGTYTFAMDITCDGTFIQTITKSVTITAINPYSPAQLSLQASNALICDGGTDMKISMQPVGGTAPFTFEYKLESATSYTPTPSSGTQNYVSITPVPAVGTVYDIKVTDACGTTATAKVSVASFTGQFYITAYIPDCANPFITRLRTSAVNQAYYTWKRNGTIIAQGFNIYEVTILGVTQDEISVDVDIYGCYFRNATRTIIFNNNCEVKILPLQLVSFEVRNINNNTNKLSWETENEVNTSYFDIEKSDDGTSFTKVGTVSSLNRATPIMYTWDDVNFNKEKAYYRLKIVDASGKYFYSAIINMRAPSKAISILKISPNPVKYKLNLYYKAPNTNKYTVTIYDNLGKAITKDNYTFIKNGSSIDINIENLPNGNYYIQISDNQSIKATNPFIKL
jgi:Secretion system C-terminal sorting domain